MEHMIGVAPALESPITLQRRLFALSQDVVLDSTTSCDNASVVQDEEESSKLPTAEDQEEDQEEHRPSLESTASQRRAQMELYDYAQRRMSRRSIVDLRGQRQPILPDSDDAGLAVPAEEMNTMTQEEFHDTGYRSIEFEENAGLISDVDGRLEVTSHKPAQREWQESLSAAVGQVPAVTVVALLWLMMALPFGVAYFPIGWSSDDTTTDDADGMKGAIHGPFPLPGKEALGIRMCLVATNCHDVHEPIQQSNRLSALGECSVLSLFGKYCHSRPWLRN